MTVPANQTPALIVEDDREDRLRGDLSRQWKKRGQFDLLHHQTEEQQYGKVSCDLGTLQPLPSSASSCQKDAGGRKAGMLTLPSLSSSDTDDDTIVQSNPPIQKLSSNLIRTQSISTAPALPQFQQSPVLERPIALRPNMATRHPCPTIQPRPQFPHVIEPDDDVARTWDEDEDTHHNLLKTAANTNEPLSRQVGIEQQSISLDLRVDDEIRPEYSHHRAAAMAYDNFAPVSPFHRSPPQMNFHITGGGNRALLVKAKTSLLHALAIAGGDVEDSRFQSALEQLTALHRFCVPRHSSSKPSSQKIEGMWITLSKPNYLGCLGKNSDGDYLYTLGRMAFDMYRPTNLVCSVQGSFNEVARIDLRAKHEHLTVPSNLKQEVFERESVLRRYNIITAFKVEPNHPAYGSRSSNASVLKPIKGVMTTYGYVLPDPDIPSRLTVWFSGGKMELGSGSGASDDGSAASWEKIFGSANLPKRNLTEQIKMLTVKLLMGAQVNETLNKDDGSLSFSFSRPVGGHGKTYVDVVYLDETLRIVRGHRGTVFVFARVPSSSK